MRTLGCLCAALLIAACGGASSTTPATRATPTTAAPSPQIVTMVQGRYPQSLDPAADYSPQGAEVNWLVYTGLTTYAHATGAAGTRLIAGLATSLPAISDGGRTYTVTLRRGLRYSDGQPVRASDFARAVERAIRLPWGGAAQFVTPVIAGGSAYATGRARTVSGITADDRTGAITIHLVAPYGPFDNVLAFPALGLVPAATPLHAQPASPPPGAGPYAVTNIVPGRSYTVVRNRYWTAVDGIPAGHVRQINVRVSGDLAANAQAVASNTTDVFDALDQVPAGALTQVRARAAGRFADVNLGGSTEYVFFNTLRAPFSSQPAREAVVTGLDQATVSALGAAPLDPGCFFVPAAVIGHPSGPCPYGDGTGDLSRARALVRRSGTAGARVTVWSPAGAPRQRWMAYYVSLLGRLGYRATLRVVPAQRYFAAIGVTRLGAQTGFADWSEDFPDPVDFYLLLDGAAIQPTGNEDYGQVSDPRIENAIATLGQIPSPQLPGAAAQWQALDEYTARRAYVAVLGYQTVPKLLSARMDFAAAVLSPVYGWDLSSLAVK